MMGWECRLKTAKLLTTCDDEGAQGEGGSCSAPPASPAPAATAAAACFLRYSIAASMAPLTRPDAAGFTCMGCLTGLGTASGSGPGEAAAASSVPSVTADSSCASPTSWSGLLQEFADDNSLAVSCEQLAASSAAGATWLSCLLYARAAASLDPGLSLPDVPLLAFILVKLVGRAGLVSAAAEGSIAQSRTLQWGLAHSCLWDREGLRLGHTLCCKPSTCTARLRICESVHYNCSEGTYSG